MELQISKDRKYEWLAKNGPPDALQLLGLQVEDFVKQADEQQLAFKETKEVKDALDAISFDATIEPVIEEAQTQAVQETAQVEDVVEVKEVNAVDAQVTEFSELVDALTENLVTPIAEALAEVTNALKEQQEQIQTLQKELNAIKQQDAFVKEALVEEDKLPTASVAALVKQRIEAIMNSNNRFGAPVKQDEPLLKQKPAEGLVTQVKDSPFASFLTGA
jgi:vacuolar-type H+-ATPase subunit I/STV1